MSDQTVNLPQLLFVLLLSGLAIRYFFFSPNSPSSSSTHSSSSSRNSSNSRAREADVERIQQMFPQIPRRTIMWDLQRNGGNVAATTERILSGRGLEEPPQSFQPPLPTPSTSPSSTTPTSTSKTPTKPLQPDLITRYNLAAKVAEQSSTSPSNHEAGKDRGEEAVAPVKKESQQQQAWSSNKAERQALLQKRREEMILAARRKMEEKVRREGGSGVGGDT